MILRTSREHVFVTEKYGSLRLFAEVQLDTEADRIDPADLEATANEVLDATLSPAIERMDRSLDINVPGDEFVRAWVLAGGTSA